MRDKTEGLALGAWKVCSQLCQERAAKLYEDAVYPHAPPQKTCCEGNIEIKRRGAVGK